MLDICIYLFGVLNTRHFQLSVSFFLCLIALYYTFRSKSLFLSWMVGALENSKVVVLLVEEVAPAAIVLF